jgi:hypothetical protein
MGALNHCMTRPQVANGGSELQIWRVAENISNILDVLADVTTSNRTSQ